MSPPMASISILDLRPIPLASIDIVEGNPRHFFDEFDLADLAASIREHGVFQPIVVTRIASRDRFRLIAGERRVRASFLAEKSEIRAVIIEGDEDALRSIQFDENVLRVQLNPIEEALALAKMRDENMLSLSALAHRVKRRPNYVRARLALLHLTQRIQSEVAGGRLSLGAASELCRIAPDQGQEFLSQQIVEQQLTVAQTAQLVRDHRLSLRRRERVEALRGKRDGLVRHFSSVVPAVVTSETFDGTKHHLSRWLIFPECGPCPKKGVFVSDECVGQDCCLDPECYRSLARRGGEAEQAHALERYAAFRKVPPSGEISPPHLRFILWAILRGFLSDTDSWRTQVDLPDWHGGKVGTEEWMLIENWPADRLLGSILQLTTDYLAHRSNALLPLGLRKSLHEDVGVAAGVLDLPSDSQREKES